MTDLIKQTVLDYPLPSAIGSGILICGLGIYAYGETKDFLERQRFRKLTLKKQEERRKIFAELKKKYKVTPDQISILTCPLDELIERLQSRELTSVEVLNAFIAKSLEVHEATNCLTEFIPNAEKVAAKLDGLAQPKGPLHGLPICVKDDYFVKGMDSTLGYAKNLYKPKSESATMVKVLEGLGAVPFVRTNFPQSMFSYAGENPIFGRTVNGLNPKLGPGGSSSGTGALICGGGAPLGLGSDFGGSVRIPAHFHGISTIKCTQRRLSVKRIESFLPGIPGNTSVPGIFTKTAKELAIVVKAVLEGEELNKDDPTVVPIPWNEKAFSSTQKLRFGYYTSYKFFPALGDTSATVIKAKKALESQGHTLVPFEFPNESEWTKLIYDLNASDQYEHIKNMFKNEAIAEPLKDLNALANTPVWKRRALGWLYSILPGANAKNTSALLRFGLDTSTVPGVWRMLAKKEELTNALLDKMNAEGIDLILCPTFPFCAPRVEAVRKLFGMFLYTGFWNNTDFPAGVVKFGIESGNNLANFDTKGDPVVEYAINSMQDSIGMPITVQIVGRPFREEMVLRIMTELESAYRP